MSIEPEKEECPVCHGTGSITVMEIHAYRTHDKEIPREKGCEYCNETGFVKPLQVLFR